MDAQTVLDMTVVLLKAKLRELGLPLDGRKKDLRDRLLQHYGLLNDDDEEEDNDYESVLSQREAGVVTREPFAGPYFTFKDIQDSLPLFNGTDNLEVDQWVEQFEENAETVGWLEVHKFIYAKQLLRGAAKSFVRSQVGLNSWDKLKVALVEEFGESLSSVEVHRQLTRRQKRPNESLLEYLYSLMEIGRKVSIDEASLVDYFVGGIQDSKSNKAVLYQAKNLHQLKEQIKIYEKITTMPPSYSREVKPKGEIVSEKGRTQEVSKKCFKCGDVSHIARNCTVQGQLIRCFKCNKIGHKANQCPSSDLKIKSEKTNLNTVHEKKWVPSRADAGLRFKKVRVGNIIFPALLDTGSGLCLIRQATVNQLDLDIKINKDQRMLEGIGHVQIRTLGSFEVQVVVDGLDLELTFHIIRDRDMDYPAILGRAILSQVDLIIREKGDELHQKQSYREKVTETESRIKELSEEFAEICMQANEAGTDQNDLSHLRKEELIAIERLISEYVPKKSITSPVTMKIVLTDDTPVYQRPRRTSYEDQRVIEKQVENWLDEGIITTSISDFASPVVLVGKKDGTKRLCCDYRKLNEKVVRDNFPMALMDEVLERLQGSKVFTTLDLENGFFHVPVEENSRKYTAFVTNKGQYEFKYVPFGISNAPAVFCRYINTVFRELINDGTMVVYMDDLIIPSTTEAEGIVKLQRVLEVAAEAGLRIKWKKCSFLKRRVDFLGYIIENNMVRPSTEKISVVESYKIPKDRKGVQRFVGLTSYFRRFIKNYALIAKPLTDLLRGKLDFKWGDEQTISFQQLKEALVQAPVLKLYNPKGITEIHTDASKFGYGAVLLQQDPEDQQFHPVMYMSRKTKLTEEKYHSYELEVLAIVEALKKWRIYVLGLPFKIVTDCNAFAMTLKKKDVPTRVARWAMFLQEFNYIVEHRNGTRMKHADALSRLSCMLVNDSLRHRLKEAQIEDDWTRAVRKLLETSNYEDFYIHHDILYKDQTKELIVIPKALQDEIIQVAHKQGHFSVKKTCDCVEKEYFIPELESKATKVVKSCVECLIMNAKNGKKEGLLSPIDKENHPLSTYHIDHVGPMTVTGKQYSYILVVVDAFSKFVWLYPTKDTGTDAVIDRLTREAHIFGNPHRIITDRGTAFTSHRFKDYCETNGIQHLLITTGVPRGNEQVERMHRVVVPMLAKLSQGNAAHCYKYVGQVQQFLNNTPSRSTTVAPFKLMTGCEMRIKEDLRLKEILDGELIQSLNEGRDKIREIAKANIQKVQEENRKTYNKNRKPGTQYSINDLVAIKRTQFGVGMKLRPKFLGPYKVIKKLNHDRYEVERMGSCEGPRMTSASADNMKQWEPRSRANALSGMAEL